MSENLNQNLYKRFGLQLSKEKVESGFRKHVANAMWDAFYPLKNPTFYKEKFHKPLREARVTVLQSCCRELFLDYSDYTSEFSGIEDFIKDVFDENKSDYSFEEYLLHIQIVLNVFWKHEILQDELWKLAEEIQQYFADFPILGAIMKIYKIKAPQILPTTSKKFEQEIKNTLGLLETDKKYEYTLSHFENGLKEFLTAKTQAQYKDVVEDMYTACDDLVKAVLGNKSKGFKHISDKADAAVLKLNGHQKELYKNLRNWMDGIKHSTIKDFDRHDTEMIISMVGSLVRFVISKHDQ